VLLQKGSSRKLQLLNYSWKVEFQKIEPGRDLKVAPLSHWKGNAVVTFLRPIQALTRQPALLSVVNFRWPKSMKTPRLIILSSAVAILALTLISCETGSDTTTTTKSQTAVTGPPPPPMQSSMGGYSRGGY
jgi:hypothetical protein